MTPPVPPGPLVPAKKKTNVLLWVLIGVGGFFFLIIVGVLAGGLFLAHKVREGHFEMKSADGAIQIGGDAKVPAWVPVYPGSKPQNAFSALVKDGRSGTFVFKTSDSPDRVAQYYREQFEAAGLRVNAVVSAGTSQILSAQDTASHHAVTVVAGGQGNETSVNVSYATK
jgi:hypothetical protein